MKRRIFVSIVAGLVLSFSTQANPVFFDVNEVDTPTASFGGWLEKQLGGGGSGGGNNGGCLPDTRC